MVGTMSIFWVLLLGLGAEASVVPVLEPDKPNSAVPDRSQDILALNLDLALDFDARTIAGTAAYTVLRLGSSTFVLDQVALNIESVSVDGEEVVWRTPGDTLSIDLPSRIKRGGEGRVLIRYSATPRTGLHFRDPGPSSPDQYPEVWTQGQKNDNRYWFPAWDHPNDRFEYTGAVTGPDGWRIKTNTGMNLPSYLVMIAAGPYQERGGPDNRVWVGPNAAERGVDRVWSAVPDMMEHFAERTGVEYPWGEFMQVFVQRFMYGGMENTGATINTNDVVRGERVGLTRDRIQSLVAHELAHQWYGDLLTCRTWRDLWLNEGFASFFGDDWLARRDGPERWAMEVLKSFRGSQTENALAGRFFHGPDAAANHNVYAKGSSVLQMLRVMLGEEVFWEAIRDYTRSHARSLVRTADLQAAMERASGQELGWFFQQWVELPHVPRLTVSDKWADGVLTITVAQAITEKRPRYTVPFSIEVGHVDGAVMHSAILTDGKIQIQIPLESPPTYVAFDPQAGVLAKLENKQEPEAWTAQLSSGHPAAVFRAISALADTDVAEPLAAVLADKERHFLVRAAAAMALGEQGQMRTLRAFSADEHDRVRMAVVTALGHGLDGKDLPLLERRLRSDKNSDVRQSALESIAQISPMRGTKLARGVLGSADPDLAASAARILGVHGSLTDLPSLMSMKLRRRIRTRGLRAAAKLIGSADEGPAQDRAMAKLSGVLVGLLGDLDVRARQTAVSLLKSTGDKSAIPHLEVFRREETIKSLSKKAQSAVTEIRGREGKVQTIAAENKHEARMKELEDRIDALESQLSAYEDKH
jgi:aminopeptidase N